ncbi:TetR/AcrR family transcriptional regulator [Erythrobacter sanguineus]|uniref:TetR/AcrR family transcriptional regulator n=1 Tax=Erythrobacter sanguineus TaxID=198312 RepID=UPI000934E164|nr:TetR/AcrR family transcriptional regulator [Erythrobacter sanguineus]
MNAGKWPRHRPIDLAKREAILDAARDEFFMHGFAGASIETIASRSAVSKVTVYNRFKTKEALFTAMVQRECVMMGADFVSPEEAGGDLRDTLMIFGQAVIHFLTQPHIISFGRRIGAEAELRPEVGELFLNTGPRRMQRELTALLEASVANGKIRCHDCCLAAGHLFGLLCGFDMCMARFSTEEPDREKLCANVSDAVDRFLKAYGV